MGYSESQQWVISTKPLTLKDCDDHSLFPWVTTPEINQAGGMPLPTKEVFTSQGYPNAEPCALRNPAEVGRLMHKYGENNWNMQADVNPDVWAWPQYCTSEGTTKICGQAPGASDGPPSYGGSWIGNDGKPNQQENNWKWDKDVSITIQSDYLYGAWADPKLCPAGLVSNTAVSKKFCEHPMNHGSCIDGDTEKSCHMGAIPLPTSSVDSGWFGGSE